MKKFFAILTAAVLVVACGGGTITKTNTKPKTIEDQLLAHLVKIEKAVMDGEYEQTRAAAVAHYEWEQSLNESQKEELAVAYIKHDAYITRVLTAWDEWQSEVEGLGCCEDVDITYVYSNSYDGYLNVRAQPSAKSRILGRLPNGPEGAELLWDEGKWTKVRVDGVEGYVWSANLQSTPTDPVYIKANEVIGEWIRVTYSSGYCYEILENGKYLYSDSDGNEKAGTWYLSYHNLILKHSNGTTTVCTLENDMLTIGDWSYERYTE